jgi:RND family efflux transporter MFP subunit
MFAKLSKPMHTTLTRTFWIGAGLILLAGCQGSKNQYAPPPPPTVTVAHPVTRPVTEYFEDTGTVQAFESVEIRARVVGYLEKINFESGAPVKKGDLLFTIDPKPYRAELNRAEADLSMRKAEFKLSEVTLKRKESALLDNAISEVEVIEARAKREQAQAAVEAAEAAVETTRLNLSYTEIHAPINGRISRNQLDGGNLVGAAGQPTLLATIVATDPVYVYFNINERDLLNHRQKTFYNCAPGPCGERRPEKEIPVFLGLANETGYPHQGRGDYMDTGLDTDSGTIQVRAIFANTDQYILPGLFARLRVPVGPPQPALLIPNHALGADQQGNFVLVVNTDNIVEYRPVETGPQIDDMRVICSGITAQESVIINGLQRGRPGLAVNPVLAEMPALAAVEKSAEIR